MTNPLARCTAIAILLTFGLCSYSGAQTSSKNGKKAVVGIVLHSNYQRISDFLPRLREYLVKNVPNRRKGVQLIAIDDANPFEAARKNQCDYLLQLDIQEASKPTVGVAFGGPNFSGAGSRSGSEDLDRRVLENAVFRSHLSSIGNDSFDKSDRDRVLYGEFPTHWDAMAFETTVMRSAERVTLASLKKLPKN